MTAAERARIRQGVTAALVRAPTNQILLDLRAALDALDAAEARGAETPETVERVARAMCAAEIVGSDRAYVNRHWECHIQDARAALAALRETTPMTPPIPTAGDRKIAWGWCLQEHRVDLATFEPDRYCPFCSGLAEEIAQARAAGVQAERARCAAMIPTTWLDPLLTGPTAALSAPPWDCPDIERLLQRIAAALREGQP